MWKSRWLTAAVFLTCLAPAIWLAREWYENRLGVNPIEYVARYSGRWTLRLLLITLAITPIRRIVTPLAPIVRFRRMIGLFTFGYGAFHGWHYFARDAQWYWEIIMEDLTYRRFFVAGAIALVLMLPLAVTSFDAAVRWLGGARWRLLHRLVYFSAISAIIHFLWQGKGWNPDPVKYGLILAILLGARFILWLRKR